MDFLNDTGESPLQSFQTIAQQERSLLLQELWDSPKAALIAFIAKNLEKNILFIHAETHEAKLFEDLTFFELGDKLFDFPSWETLPGEEIAPSPDIIGKRFGILHALLRQKKCKIVLCPLQAALQKLPSKETTSSLCRLWKRGEEIPFASLSQSLVDLGYRRQAIVADKGEFAIRGGILDIFPLSSPDPFRLDFFGDTIEEIRTYDPISQKSIGKTDRVFLCPASELELMRQEKKPSILLDYLGDDPLIFFDDLLALEDRYVSFKSLPGFSSSLFCLFEEFLSLTENYSRIFLTKERIEELSHVFLPSRVGRDFYSKKNPLQPLHFDFLNRRIETKLWHHSFVRVSDFFCTFENKTAATCQELLYGLERSSSKLKKLSFITETDSDEKSLLSFFEKEHLTIPPHATFQRGYLSSGFVLDDTALIPMTEFTHRLKTRRQKWRSTYHTPASDFHELKSGDIVVHFQHGLGRYLGVEKRLNHLGHETEFLKIEYAEKSTLFVPMNQAHLVSRYIGAHEEVPTFSAIGSGRWQKTVEQAQKAVVGYAQDLLRLSAERELRGGFAYPADSQEQLRFESDFPFVPTEDQLHAIADIKKDMISAKAMDRLICGDVGYGKTEVAMRAAFKAVVDGHKQVAILVPTTVLAMQHFETFSERMANYPLRIAVVSRFRTAKEIKTTLLELQNGTVDILIGTHRLLSKDVIFKDLGLLIIDEEQRFGVRAKEHLKALKTGVDCLTLSATPIPRTLYLSLISAKDISVINTPPQDRLPIKTIIAKKEPSVLQNALLRELSRDGQAYIIHNRVESIFLVADEIQKLLPQARIVVGHGQMSTDEIDIVFHSFKAGKADILVATTIVENGIDIPNANTILIDRADQFGLADLYQLRGRVGRWNRPAYAYFLIPHQKELAELTLKRLYALVEASGYGGGMKIAMRDLELRGAGDILGTQQSGQISAIGFHLYCKLLKRTIDALRKKQVPHFFETKIESIYDARIPEEYIEEPSIRMEIYHRFGAALSFADLDEILAELKDRFGPYPTHVLWLYHLTRLKIFASAHQFNLLKFDAYTLLVEQKKGKTNLKKTLPMPRSKIPAELERKTIEALQKNFSLTN
ncbi:MAG: transcription-repair coupling factor [Anaerolineae bacterium]